MPKIDDGLPRIDGSTCGIRGANYSGHGIRSGIGAEIWLQGYVESRKN
jgi:hypothetical protein